MLIRLSVPPAPEDHGAWLRENAGSVSFALVLVPFAGVAFLWFMGVVRDRIGTREDRFFSGVLYGSGLLFLAMTFVAAALAGALLATHASQGGRPIDGALYTLVRTAMERLTSGYSVNLAGVFMFSLATISLRTRTLPRALTLATYPLALGLLLAIGTSLWIALIFPAWVCAVSGAILLANRSARDA